MNTILAMAKAPFLQTKLITTPLEKGHFDQLAKLSDLVFGPGYMHEIGLESDWDLILLPKTPICWAIFDQNDLVASRLTYPPGRWKHLRAWHRSHQDKWGVNSDAAAYFKTSLVHPNYRGMGLGRSMAIKTIKNLKALGAQAAITHSWNESPGGSSRAFTESLGFACVAFSKGFWSEYAYDCQVCQSTPCECSASEMVLKLYPERSDFHDGAKRKPYG